MAPPSWTEHWELIGWVVGALLIVVVWFWRQDRSGIKKGLETLTEELREQRKELHDAVLRHEVKLSDHGARITTLEAVTFVRRRSDHPPSPRSDGSE